MANAEALLDSEWLQWSANLLRAVGAHQPAEEVAALREQLYAFASRVLLRDMMSSDRQRCRLAKLGDLIKPTQPILSPTQPYPTLISPNQP